MGKKNHLHFAPENITLGVITVSTTRTVKEDKSGLWIQKQAHKEGLIIEAYKIVPDRRDLIVGAVTGVLHQHDIHVLILTGGSGIGAADVTIEAVRPMFAKEMTSFASLFTWLSFEKIDSAALLSRAAAGIIGKTAVFCLPGSLDACKLACTELIFPEIKHIAAHLVS
jgi:molybdenum cofactor biosynthesis protein B